MVGKQSNFWEVYRGQGGSTKLFMFNCGPLLLKWGEFFKTVCVMGPCNKLNGVLIVFFLCDIRYSNHAVFQINAQWTIFEICAERQNVFCSECWAKNVSPGVDFTKS